MKALFFGLGLLFSVNALASIPTEQCFEMTRAAVEKFIAGKGYDKDGVFVDGCGVTINGTILVCEASVSKGAAADTYRAFLNYVCTKVYRVEKIYEE